MLIGNSICAIQRAADNSYLGLAAEPLRAGDPVLGVLDAGRPRRGLVAWEEHVAILSAIEAGDADEADRAQRAVDASCSTTFALSAMPRRMCLSTGR